MNLFQPFREEVTKVSTAVGDTFDFLMGKINALWNVQHKADGSHGAITATGLSVPADGTTGAGTVSSDLIPSITNTYRLGGQSLEHGPPIYAWKELWAITQYWGSTSTVAGTIVAGWTDTATTANRTTTGQGDASAQKWTIKDSAGNSIAIFGGDVTIGGAAGPGGITLAFLVVSIQAEFTNGLFERARSKQIGEWIAVTFNAGNFTGSGTITWTVASGDQTTLAYMLVGKTMVISFVIQTSTVAGAGGQLRIAIPGGFTAARAMFVGGFALDNGVAIMTVVGVFSAGASVVTIQKADLTNWAAATDTTEVYGQLTFEVQ